MKKILSIMLVAMMVLSCFSVVTFADEYDATFKMVTDKTTYSAGDYLRLDFNVDVDNADEMIYTEGYKIHVAYDSGLLTYASNKNEVKNAFGLTARPATLPAVAWLATSSSGIDTSRTDGEFIDALGYEAGEFWDGDNAYTVFFKVNEDIKGTHELNFKWVLGSKNTPSSINYSDGGLELKDYNVKFVDTAVTIVGEDMTGDSEFLSSDGTYAFAGKNEPGKNTIEVNGVQKEITSRYAVAYSKVAPRNGGATRVEAGFIISKENSNLTIDNSAAKKFVAKNFAFDNIFTGVFYGPGLEAEETYYVMPYVTYSDGVTLYADEAKSFTMPQ